jgi:Fe-S-cluster-containing dehydrogenase component
MSSKWNMIVDVAKCENCQNCFIATKDEHVGNDFPGYAAPQPLHGHQWIDIRRQERGEHPIIDVHFMPVMCNHCDDAPCMRAARNGAIYKRPDGIVIIDPVNAKGQKQILDACPYGAIFWNEELQLPQNWIFDAHLLDDGWTQTRAEQVCPTGVFRSVKVTDEEMKQILDREELRVLKPELSTKPRVYYKNLHLMDRCFIAGTVVTRNDGREECFSGAKITLSNNSNEIATTTSDSFGEFKIDMLEPNSGQYEVNIEADGKPVVRKEVTLGESLYIGIVELAN